MSGFYAIIARYYDSEHHDKDDDLAFYRDAADEVGGPVLIIGAGTGRIVLDLARMGHEVDGIEQEAAMLERAQAKRALAPAAVQARINLLHGDALTLDLKRRYRLVIIPYNTLMHFHSESAHLGLLRRCQGWLDEAGLLFIDLPNPGEAFAAQDTGAVVLERMFLERETGHLVMQHSVSALDRVRQLMTVTWIYDEIDGEQAVKRTLANVVNRFFFFNELRLLLEKAGFSVADVFGDFDRSPFTDGCPRLIAAARREL
jgi:SAM-dependent methyltransferase